VEAGDSLEGFAGFILVGLTKSKPPSSWAKAFADCPAHTTASRATSGRSKCVAGVLQFINDIQRDEDFQRGFRFTA